MHWSNPTHPHRDKEMLGRLQAWFSESKSKHYLELFKEIDPTPTGKYISWLVKIWTTPPASKGGRLNEIAQRAESVIARAKVAERAAEMEEDAHVLHELLQLFHRFKNKLPLDQRDILRHTKGSLTIALQGYELPEGTRTQMYERQIAEGQKILAQDEDFRVIRITTPEAARELAKGTVWCVSSLEVGANYLAKGPLVLIQTISEDKQSYEPYVLAHHGYRRLQSHEESDPELYAASQVKDIEDNDIGPEKLKMLQPYLQIAFDEVKRQRMRKFSDTWDVKIYQEEKDQERDPQTIPFDYGQGRGQLEMDEEYYRRLIDLGSHILLANPWIEETIFGSKHENIIIDYIKEAGIIDERVERLLTKKWVIEEYIAWAYEHLRTLAINEEQKTGKERDRSYVDTWIALAQRVRRREV